LVRTRRTGGRGAGRRFGRAVALGAAVLACAAERLSAGDPPPVGLPPTNRPASSAPGLAPAALPVDATADRVDYDRTRGILVGTGHVTLRRGQDELRADYVRYDVNTGEARAVGDVTLTRGAQVVRAPTLDYNFQQGTGRLDRVTLAAPPFRVVRSDNVQLAGGQRYTAQDAVVTTCTNSYPHCHYTVTARRMEIVPGDYLRGWDATWRLGRVPVMWAPFWYQNLNERFGWRFEPGYGSRVGAYLLSSYRYPLAPDLAGETHLDYRTKRGLAAGQDLRWDLTGDGQGRGDAGFYFLNDRDPTNGDETRPAGLVDNDRHRLLLRQDLTLTARDYAALRADYLSDAYLEEDFFEDMYRLQNEPDNTLSYTHRGDDWTLNFLARKRLNDFYTVVERLPEISADFMRQQLGDSRLYYEGRTAGGFLQKLQADDSEAEDYAAFRLDTLHTLYRPARHFGFLNVVPRLAYRGTYYSRTRETVPVATATGAWTNTATTGGQTNAATWDIARGARFRSIVELGYEASYKAFRTWRTGDGEYRHIVEPHANYTWRPRPNVRTNELYQFDSLDALDEVHQAQLGVRNILQTRRPGGPLDLVDVDCYTYYKLHRAPDENGIEDVFLNAELRPAPAVLIRTDGGYNLADAAVDHFNARCRLGGSDVFRWGVEYRYQRNDSSLLAADLTLRPKRRWTYSLYGRYEFEQRRCEEVGGYIQRNLDCLAMRLGVNFMPGYTLSDGSRREDDLRFILGLWLTAFPESGLTGRYGG
jgi:LPS-assembly protein